MYEVKVPQSDKKFQKGGKLIRLTVYLGDRSVEHVTYEENISVENGCVTLIDIDNQVHKIINAPVVIDYDYEGYWYKTSAWKNWDVMKHMDKMILEEKSKLTINKEDE